ncbi:hypothetical protein ACIQW5_27120 [Methylorubrum thiocyanatum]|uniref:hypothetical protein n=1 Tax=Methylorubrum thiocyanatum TaxID=47958 RepID=UPI00383B20FC
MSDDTPSSKNETQITEQEAKEKFPEQFKTLKSAQPPIDGKSIKKGKICAWSKCINGKQLIMKYDSAGNCTIYEHTDC